jgi:hypothetical protein
MQHYDTSEVMLQKFQLSQAIFEVGMDLGLTKKQW